MAKQSNIHVMHILYSGQVYRESSRGELIDELVDNLIVKWMILDLGAIVLYILLLIQKYKIVFLLQLNILILFLYDRSRIWVYCIRFST